MTSVTTDKLPAELPDVLRRVQESPVYVKQEGQDVAVLVSLADFEGIRMQMVERFERLRDEISQELEAKLAKEGITVEEFLKDVLSDD